MDRLKGVRIRRPAVLTIFLCALAAPLFALTGCEQWARMEENQVKLQAMVAANARQLAAISSQVHVGQAKLTESIGQVDEGTREVAAEVRSVQNEQVQLRDTVVSANERLDGRMTELGRNQDSLENGVAQVADVTQRTAADVTALARENVTLQQVVRANQQELTGSIGAVAGSQQHIQTGISHLQQSNERLAGSVTAVADQQNKLHQALQDNDSRMTDQLTALAGGHGQIHTDIADGQSALQESLGANHQELTGRLASLTQAQQGLQVGVDTLNSKADSAAAELAVATSSLHESLRTNQEVLTSQMAASLQNQQGLQTATRDVDVKMDALTGDLAKVATGQTALHETLGTNHGAVVAGLKDVSENQSRLSRSVSGLDEKTDAVRASQDTMSRTMREHGDAVSRQATEYSGQQQALQDQLDILTATISQTALDIVAFDTRQAALQQAVRIGMTDLGARMGDAAGNQQQTQNGLDVLTATAGQTQLDIINMAAQQDTLHQAVQSHDAAAGGQMTRLADRQQQIQSSLDTVTSTTGQAALDVGTLNGNQTRMEQALQAGRDELITRLAEIAQGQQNWLQRFDAAQANVDTMAKGIVALEQQVARLQGTLQTSIQELTSHLDTEGQQRLQLEAKVSQDIQAVIESISQLRQTQTSLQEQMTQTQVQRNTQSQTRNIEPAPEPLTQQPAEVKVSDAGTKIEDPAVVEAVK